MIGIPFLDNLTTETLILIVNGDMEIKIPVYPKLQLSLDPDEKPGIQEPIEIMDNQKVITLCKMEIESRLGWAYLAEKIQENRN